MSASNFSLPTGRYTPCDCCHNDVNEGIVFDNVNDVDMHLCYFCITELNDIAENERIRRQREFDKALRHGQNYSMGKHKMVTGQPAKGRSFGPKDFDKFEKSEIPDDTNHY